MSNCLLGVDELHAAGEKAEGKTLAHQLKVDPPNPAEGYFSAFSYTHTTTACGAAVRSNGEEPVL